MSKYGAIPGGLTSSQTPSPAPADVAKPQQSPPTLLTSLWPRSRSSSPAIPSRKQSRPMAAEVLNAVSRGVRFASTQGGPNGRNLKGLEAPLSTPIDGASVVDSEDLENTAHGQRNEQNSNGQGQENGQPLERRQKSRVCSIPPPIALTLENSGSVARDHLALERTFLAYVRTSLAIASAGVALVQLFTISARSPHAGVPMTSHLQRFARPLGAATVIVGLFVLIIGSTRFFHVQTALVIGKFPPARNTVIFVSAALIILVAVVFGILVSVPR